MDPGRERLAGAHRFSLIYTTFGDRKSAVRAAEALVAERLAACTNEFEIRSVYRWKGDVHHDAEIGMFIKTSKRLVPRAVARLRELHPYENPCAVEVPLTRGRGAYLDWIRDSTLSPRPHRPARTRSGRRP